MRILLFGGAFDPVHYGHLAMLRQAIMEWHPDQTFLVPTRQKWWSERWLSAPADRVAMLELALKNDAKLANQPIQISTLELDQPAPNCAEKMAWPWVKVLEHFQKAYPTAEIAFLVGEDQYQTLPQWVDGEQLPKLATILVYPRLGVKHLERLNWPNVHFLAGQPSPISSTLIRTQTKPEMLPPAVLKYINEHGLYAPERVQANCGSDKRYKHCLRVGVYAEKLMNLVDPAQAHLAKTAGIYHDICKEMAKEEQVAIAERHLGLTSYVSWRVLHGPVGAWFLQQHYAFQNEAILNAIRRHTKPFDYGVPTTLDKIVYLADKLEPMRTDEDVYGESVAEFRKLAEQDYDACFHKLYSLLEGKY